MSEEQAKAMEAARRAVAILRIRIAEAHAGGEPEAAELALLLARCQERPAQRELASRYAEGRGVLRDEGLAAFWQDVAAGRVSWPDAFLDGTTTAPNTAASRSEGSSGARRQWVPLLFVLAAVVCVAYFMYWVEPSVRPRLNRLGIVLNVISGVLLTPQVLGLDRIRSTEKWVEEVLRVGVRELPFDMSQRFIQLTVLVVVFDLALFLLVTAAVVVIYQLTPLVAAAVSAGGLGVVCAPPCLVLVIRQRGRDFTYSRGALVFGLALLSWPVILLPILIGLMTLGHNAPEGGIIAVWRKQWWKVPLAVVAVSLVALLSYPAAALSWVLRNGLEALEGDDGLLGLLTLAGLLSMVVGNAAQLIATYP